MPSIRALSMVILALLLAIVLIYLIHVLYMPRNEVAPGKGNYVNLTTYEELMSNYTNLLTKYTALLRELNECLANGNPSQQVSLSHREIIASGLTLNATLMVTGCNGYSLQSARELYFETKGPGYLVITYRLSNPQVIEGSISYYVYVMAQAIPSMPITAVYTYVGPTYAYEAGQYGQLIIPVLPNTTYTLTLGFTCYAAEYYPPSSAGVVSNDEIPEGAVVNVTYVWWGH